MNFLRTTVLGGLVVVAPLLAALGLVSISVMYAARAGTGALRALGIESALGAVELVSLTILAFLLLCFAAGLALRTAAGSLTHEKIEKRVLEKLPGYALVRPVVRGFVGDERAYPIALVDLHGSDARAVGIVVDEFDAERRVVFLPFSPTPTVGRVYVVPHDHVELTGTYATSGIGPLSQWGYGLDEIVAGADTDATKA